MYFLHLIIYSQIYDSRGLLNIFFLIFRSCYLTKEDHLITEIPWR